MSFDERMAGLAARAADAHATSDGFATDTLKARVRRGRRVRATVATVGTVAALAVVGVVGAAVADGWRTVPPATSATPDPVPTTTATAAPTTVPPTTTPDESVQVLEGWTDAGVDPAVFGGVTLTGAVELGGRVVVVGCANDAGPAPEFPAWVAEEPGAWVQATGPAPGAGNGACPQGVTASPHGLFAAFPELYRSDDGFTWSRVDLGLSELDGYVSDVWAVGDRVTALVSQPSVDESRVATLYTTTDGERWEPVDDERARVFDAADPAAILPRPDGGLLAVGTSLSAEFMPTAAMWTSDDGLTWTLTSPPGEGFADCTATDVTPVPGGYTAVGTCSESMQARLAVWSSADGATWSAPVLPPDASADEDSIVTAVSVSRVGEVTFAVGTRFDGERVRAVWRTEPDGTWVEVAADAVVPVPARVVEVGGRTVGLWWPPPSGGAGPVRVLVADD